MSIAHDKIVYAGIGSRETPDDILEFMANWARLLAPDAVLRTGGAKGADLAFEYGADAGDGEIEVYLPWASYNADDRIAPATLDGPSDGAFEIAGRYHPGWPFLKHGARKLHARNAHIVLGEDLDDPVDLVVCWTPDGSKDGKGKKVGGTGQALRMAAAYEIEVYNLADPEDYAALEAQASG